MTQQVFNVVEGQTLNQSMGFVANSVTINNLTQSWAYVTATQTFIPPYQYGVVIPLPGTDIADITWQTPTSLPVGPVGTGTLSAAYSSLALAPSNGVSVFTQQTQIGLGSVATGTNTSFLLPAGCQALFIIAQGGGPLSVKVTGVATNNNYFDLANTPTSQGLIVPVSATDDPTINVQNTSGITVSVVALFTAPTEPVVQVNVQPVSQAVFAVTGTVAPVTALYLPVLQRPTFAVASLYGVTIAVAGTQVIAAPAAGSEIVLRSLELSTVPAAVGYKVGIAATGSSVGSFATETTNGEIRRDWADYAIGDNNPLFLTASIASVVYALITYSIVTTASWPLG